MERDEIEQKAAEQWLGIHEANGGRGSLAGATGAAGVTGAGIRM